MASKSANIPRYPIRIASLALFVILLAFSSSPVYALTELWNAPITLDDDTDVGVTLSLAAVNGLPAISYFDFDNGDLKYIQASNSEGTAWNTAVIISDTPGAGGDNSLVVLPTSQFPAVSYYDIPEGALKYVRALDINGAGWGSPKTIDSGVDVGMSTSLFIVQGYPAISYYDFDNTRLKYVRANDAYGDSWGSPVVVDESSDMGMANSLAVVNGYPAISYYDYNNEQLMFRQASDIYGNTWNKDAVIVDTNGDVGDYNSMAVIEGRPAISYYDVDNENLLFIRANDSNGDTWPSSPLLLDNDGIVGEDSSLAVINGVPAISYWDASRGFVKYIVAEDTAGNTWGEIISPDKSGTVGGFTSLAPVNGLPCIAYYDDVNGNLRFVSMKGTVDITIQDGSAMIPDDSGSVNFGSTPQGAPVTKTFTIYNHGTTALDLSLIQVSNGFSLIGGYDTRIPAGSSKDLQIRLDAFSAGTFNGTFSITNPDAEKSPYNFAIIGEVTADSAVVLEAPILAPANGSVIMSSPIQVAFNRPVKSDGGAGAANNPDNYLLVEAGSNNTFETTTCALGVSGDDAKISISAVTYDSSSYTATLHFSPLASGFYQLLVCGTTSIEGLDGRVLNNGLSDSRTRFTVISTTSSGNTGSGMDQNSLPATGFAPGRITHLPPQSEVLKYSNLEALELQIPSLGITLPIVGVPQTENGWDVTWLTNAQAGWLNGSAFPTWEGNSVLTGHVTNASGLPGPFAGLGTLKYGDSVLIQAYGHTYTYEVRENTLVLPGDTNAVLDHKERDWVSLVTCEYYNKVSGEYLFRRVVRAVLVNVQ